MLRCPAAAAEVPHRERPAAAMPVDPETLPPVSEIAAAVLASPEAPPPGPLTSPPPPGGSVTTARGASPPAASAVPHTALSDAELEAAAAAGGSPTARV